MKYLEIVPDFLSMYGLFTSQSTSQVRQEMSISKCCIYSVVNEHAFPPLLGLNYSLHLVLEVG